MTGTQRIKRGLAYLEKHGWCRGQFRDDKKRACLFGSMLTRPEVDSLQGWGGCLEDMQGITQAASQMGFTSTKDAFETEVDIALEWNDADRRRKGQVLARMRKALAKKEKA